MNIIGFNDFIRCNSLNIIGICSVSFVNIIGFSDRSDNLLILQKNIFMKKKMCAQSESNCDF